MPHERRDDQRQGDEGETQSEQREAAGLARADPEAAPGEQRGDPGSAAETKCDEDEDGAVEEERAGEREAAPGRAQGPRSPEASI